MRKTKLKIIFGILAVLAICAFVMFKIKSRGSDSEIIKEIKPDGIRIHILSPYPGSRLREYFEEHNLLETIDYYKFDSRNNVIHHTEEMTAEEIKKNFRLLVFRFENGYWYFVKFWIKSLFSIDGWKKIPKRIKMIVDYIFGWVKISF